MASRPVGARLVRRVLANPVCLPLLVELTLLRLVELALLRLVELALLRLVELALLRLVELTLLGLVELPLLLLVELALLPLGTLPSARSRVHISPQRPGCRQIIGPPVIDIEV